MIDLILQVTMPDSDPAGWAKWIIGGLLTFIVAIFGFLKWLIGLASNKTDSIVNDFKQMHTEGMTQLNQCKETLIRQELKIDKDHSDLRTELKETKYAIQTLNTKVKCQERESA